MKIRFAALVVLIVSGTSVADPMTDAQNVISLYKGSLQVDSRNPATTFFETTIGNQSVGMKLIGKPINTAFFTELVAPTMSRFQGARCLTTMSSAPTVATNFSNFEVLIDGCNISKQIILLCNAANCWLNSPTVDHSVPTDSASATLGSDFSMGSPVNLNAIDFSQCSAGTFSGMANDKKYIVEFREVPLDVCPTEPSGGRVDFEISVLNQAVSSRKGI